VLVLQRGLDLAAPLIASEKISKSFGPTEVLRHVSLAVAPKDVVCVIGPSGSGKTTLLRCLALLEQPTGGTVAMNGVTIASARGSSEERRAAREVRPDIGMVFQHFNLWPHMTVLGNLIEAPLRVKRMSRPEAVAMAEALLAKVGLSDKRDVYPNRLSGGQQQRVAIARALAMSPKVLLFDEPTSALDPISTSSVEQLFHELKANYTLIIVTHNMQQAARVSDRTAFFYLGELVEFDDTKTMFTNPRDQRTQNYITGRFS